MHAGLLEKAFDCPHCGEPITVLLDLTVEDEQDYVEDCEVCCRPIRLRVVAEDGRLAVFSCERSE